MAARLAWPIISLAFLAMMASASIIRGPRSPAESATGRFFLAPHPEQKFYQHALTGLGGNTKEDKIHEESAEPPAQAPGTNWLGLGALSNMQKFFDVLRDNLETIDDEPLYLEPKNDIMMATEPIKEASSTSFHRRPLQESSFRPTATAAYLHALRNHKPSAKMRNFVASVEPSDLRGTNNYDPAWMWTGLGRRRR